MDADQQNQQEALKLGFDELASWLSENRERALWHREQSLQNVTDVDKQIAILREIESEKEAKLQEIDRLKAEFRAQPDATESADLKELQRQIKSLPNDLDKLFDELIPEELEYLENISSAYKRFVTFHDTLTSVIEDLKQKAKEEATKVPINLNLNITSLCDGKQIESAVIRRRKTSYLYQYRTVRSELLAKHDQFEAFEDVTRYLLSEISDETISERFDDLIRSYDALNRSLEDRSRILESQIGEYERYAKTFTTAYDLVQQLDNRVASLSRDQETLDTDSHEQSIQSAIEMSRVIKRLLSRAQEVKAMRDAGQELVNSALAGNERVLNLLAKSQQGDRDAPKSHWDDVMSLESDTQSILHAHEQTLESERSQLLAKWGGIWDQVAQLSDQLDQVGTNYANTAELADALTAALGKARTRHGEILNSPLTAAEKREALKQLQRELNGEALPCLNQMRNMGGVQPFEAPYDELNTELLNSIASLGNSDSFLGEVDAIVADLRNWMQNAAKNQEKLVAICNAPFDKRDGSRRASRSGTPQRGATPVAGVQQQSLSELFDGVLRDADALQTEADTVGRSKLERLARAIENVSAKLGSETSEVRDRKRQANELQGELTGLLADLDTLRGEVPATLKRSRDLENAIAQLKKWLAGANDNIRLRKPAANLSETEQQLALFRDLLTDSQNQRNTLKDVDALTKALIQSLPANFDYRKLIDENINLQTEFENVQARLNNLVNGLQEQHEKRATFDGRCTSLRELLDSYSNELQRAEQLAANTEEAQTLDRYLKELLDTTGNNEQRMQIAADAALSEVQTLAYELEKEARLNDAEAVRQEEMHLRQQYVDLMQRGKRLRSGLLAVVEQHDKFASRRDALRNRLDDLEACLQRLHSDWKSLQAQGNRQSAHENAQAWLHELTSLHDNLQDVAQSCTDLHNRPASSDVETLKNRHSAISEIAKKLVDNILSDNHQVETLRSHLQDTANWLTAARSSLSRPPSRPASRMSSQRASPRLSLSSNAEADRQMSLGKAEIETVGRQRMNELVAHADRVYPLMCANESARTKAEIDALLADFEDLLRTNSQKTADRDRLTGLFRRFDGEYKRLRDAAQTVDRQLDSVRDSELPNEVAIQTLNTVQQDAARGEGDTRSLLNSSGELLHAGLIDNATCEALANLVNRFLNATGGANSLLAHYSKSENIYATWHADYSDCVNSIDSLEKRMTSSVESALQRSPDRQRLVAEWEADLDSAQGVYDALVNRLEQDGPACTAGQRSLMEQDIDRLDRKFDRVRAALRDFQKSVKVDPNTSWQVFDELAMALSKWLSEAERSIVLLGTPASDHVTRQTQLEKLRAIEQQLADRRADVGQLSEAYREANAVAPFSEKLETLINVRSRVDALAKSISETRSILDAPTNRITAYKAALNSCEKALLETTFELIQVGQTAASRRPSGANGFDGRASPVPLRSADHCEAVIRTVNNVSAKLPALDAQVLDVARMGEELLAYYRDDTALSGDVEQELAHIRDALSKLRLQCSQMREEYNEMLSRWRRYFNFLVTSSNFLKNDVRPWFERLNREPPKESNCEQRLAEAHSLLDQTNNINNDLQSLSRLHWITANNPNSVDQQFVQLARQLDNGLPSSVAQLNEAIERLDKLCATKQLVVSVHNTRDWVAATDKQLDRMAEKQPRNPKADRETLDRLRSELANMRKLLEECRWARNRDKAMLSDYELDDLARDLSRLAERIEQQLSATESAAQSGRNSKSSTRRSSLIDETTARQVRAAKKTFAHNNGRPSRGSSVENLNGATTPSNLRRAPSSDSVNRSLTGSSRTSTRDVASQTIKNRKVQTDQTNGAETNSGPTIKKALHQSAGAEQPQNTADKLRNMLEMMRGIQSNLQKNAPSETRGPTPTREHHHSQSRNETCTSCGNVLKPVSGSAVQQGEAGSNDRLQELLKKYVPTRPQWMATKANCIQPDGRQEPVAMQGNIAYPVVYVDAATGQPLGSPAVTYMPVNPNPTRSNTTPGLWTGSLNASLQRQGGMTPIPVGQRSPVGHSPYSPRPSSHLQKAS